MGRFVLQVSASAAGLKRVDLRLSFEQAGAFFRPDFNRNEIVGRQCSYCLLPSRLLPTSSGTVKVGGLSVSSRLGLF